MENYICIDGKKTPITVELLRELGFPVESSPLTHLVNEVRAGKRPFIPGKIIEDFGMKFKILDYDHDVNADNPEVHTVTLMCVSSTFEHYMNIGRCPNGWEETEMRMNLNKYYFKELPFGLRQMIRPTIRKTNDSKGNIHITTDKLFLPTESEMFGSAIYSISECGNRYEAFHTSNDRIFFSDKEKRTDVRTTGYYYFTSSLYKESPDDFVAVDSIGMIDGDNGDRERRVPFCFQLS